MVKSKARYNKNSQTCPNKMKHYHYIRLRVDQKMSILAMDSTNLGTN